MDAMCKGWFSEMDPFELTKVEHETGQSKNEVMHNDSGIGCELAAGAKRPVSATGEQMQIGQAWPGQAMSVRVDDVLFDQRSDYQHVQVMQT